MKRTAYVLLSAALAVCMSGIAGCDHPSKSGTGGSDPPKDPGQEIKNVLFIGNSYTYYNNLWDVFLEIATRAGYRNLSVESVTEGGWTLAGMCDPEDPAGYKVNQKFEKKHYDVVILQEQSLTPFQHPASFYDAVRIFSEIIGRLGSRGILCQTWGRKTGSPDLTACGETHESMTFKLAAAYEAIGEECGMDVSPVGSAFFDITSHHPEIELYSSDCSHPSQAGTYLAALCHYAVIYGRSPLDVEYDYAVEADEAKLLRQAAYDAVFGPSVLPSSYRVSSEGVTEK